MSLGPSAFERITILVVSHDNTRAYIKHEAVLKTQCSPDSPLVVGTQACFVVDTHVFKVADEGITWIRGWHDIDSEDVNAMWAAYKLDPSPTMQIGLTGPTGSTGPPGAPHPNRILPPAPTPSRFIPKPVTVTPRRPRWSSAAKR